jgi:hypothetical protein
MILASGGSQVMADPGQVEWTAEENETWIVPAGVYSICAVAIGGGGGGNIGSVGPSSSFYGPGGGGLHWRNDIAVTPGESLTVVAGIAGLQQFDSQTSAQNGGNSYVMRTATAEILVRGYGGKRSAGSGRLGGLNDSGTLGGGGGDGGDGGQSGLNSYAGGGGGAGGYVGKGGQGGGGAPPGGTDGDGDNGAGRPPVTDSGGGYGGDGTDDGSTGLAAGQGVGLQGRTADFAPGSRGTPKVGAGGVYGTPGQSGGVRIMWGAGRSYPDAAVDVT